MALSVQVIVAISLGAVTLVASLLLCFLLCFLKKRTATSGKVGVMQPLDNSLPDANMASDLGAADLGSTPAAEDDSEGAFPITSRAAGLYAQQSARALASVTGNSRPTPWIPGDSDNNDNDDGDGDGDDDNGAVWAFSSNGSPTRRGENARRSSHNLPLNTPASPLADSVPRPRRHNQAHRHSKPPPAPEVDDDFATPELLQVVAALDAPEDEFFLVVVQAEPGLLVAEPRLLTFPYVPGFEGLGITLAGSRPVRIMTVEAGSPAEIGGAIVGDCILQINGHMCFHLPHHSVVQLMAEELNLMRLVTVDDIPASEEIDSHIDLGLNSTEGPDARTAEWIKTLPRRTDVSKLHSRAFEMQTMASQLLSKGDFSQAERLLNQTMDVLDQLETRNKVLGTDAAAASGAEHHPGGDVKGRKGLEMSRADGDDGQGHASNGTVTTAALSGTTPRGGDVQHRAPDTEPLSPTAKDEPPAAAAGGAGSLVGLPKRKDGSGRNRLPTRPSSAVRRVSALSPGASNPPRSVKRFSRMAEAKEQMLSMPGASPTHATAGKIGTAIPMLSPLRKAPPPPVPPTSAVLVPRPPKIRGSLHHSREKQHLHQIRRYHSEQLRPGAIQDATPPDNFHHDHRHGAGTRQSSRHGGEMRQRRNHAHRRRRRSHGDEGQEERGTKHTTHHRHQRSHNKGGSHHHDGVHSPRSHHRHRHRHRRHVRSERKGLSPSGPSKTTVFRPINAVSMTPETADKRSGGPILLKHRPVNSTQTSPYVIAKPSAPAGLRLSARDFIRNASSRFVVLPGAHSATSATDTAPPATQQQQQQKQQQQQGQQQKQQQQKQQGQQQKQQQQKQQGQQQKQQQQGQQQKQQQHDEGVTSAQGKARVGFAGGGAGDSAGARQRRPLMAVGTRERDGGAGDEDKRVEKVAEKQKKHWWGEKGNSSSSSGAVQPFAPPPSSAYSSTPSTHMGNDAGGGRGCVRSGSGSTKRVSMRHDLRQQQRRLQAWMSEDPENIV